MPQQLQSLKINNLLSFGPDSPTMEFGPLNVIIGANGSGKSNLFDAIDLLKSLSVEFGKPIRESGCPLSEWFWKPSDDEVRAASFDVAIHSSEGVLSHGISFRGEERNITFVDNRVINKENGNMIAGFQGARSSDNVVDNQFEKLDFYPDFGFRKNLIEFYRTIHIYNDWTFGRKSPLRFAQNGYLPDKWLNEDGNNLGTVLRRIKQHPENGKRYLEFLQQLYENVDDYEVKSYEDGTLRVYLHEGVRVIHAARLSDGTLRYMMLLAVLCDPEPPPLVCIEEPEMGLHPDLIRTMAEALEFGAERTQVIVTTHSVQLVDCFTSRPEVIQVCEKREGSTVIERLDPEYLKPWLEKYRLGELWTSGEIGGNRW